jgi:hypothetical protein
VTMKPEPASESGAGSGLVGVALVLVLLGGVAIAPGLGFGMAISALPAWAIAESIARRRRKRGLPTSMARKIVWIAVLTIIMPIVMGLALVIAVLLICQFSGPQHFP